MMFSSCSPNQQIIQSAVEATLAANSSYNKSSIGQSTADDSPNDKQLEDQASNQPYRAQPQDNAPQNYAQGIDWSDAGSYIGEYITVCGPVVDSKYATSTGGSPTFINIGKAYPDPDRFTILIWGDDRDKFSNPPESYYYQESICVNGLVEEYKGGLEIVVSDPSQIAFQ